jgi:ABC-type lipoprotein release transport system permease subunit
MGDLDVGIGDTVTVKGSCGQRSMVVVGRTIVPLIGGDNPDVGSVIDLGGFDDLCADQLVASIDQNRGVLVRLRDDADLEAFAADLDAQGLYFEPSSRPSSVTSLGDIADAPMIVAVIAALLGSAAIAYGLSLTVRRRREDLAILRALGLRSSQTGWVITWQATIVAVISIVLGVPLGIVVGRAIWSSVAGRANLVVRPEMPPVALIGVSIGALVVALTVSVWPNLRARRLQPARVLRGE